MKSLTEKQKQEMRAHARFWAVHASHWMILAIFMVITFGLLYTFWGNDAAFAAAMIGSY